MVTISPVRRALVPVDSDAAERISAPNYDEFQGDREVWELLQQRPENLLRITMPHCHVDAASEIGQDGGPAALAHAGEQMQWLIDSPLTRIVENLLWVYEITSPKRPQAPQVGLGGFGRTADIRTEANPAGVIVRNEGIHPDKAQGRANLIEAIRADTGFVNCAVQDRSGALLAALQSAAADRAPDFTTTDEAGNVHKTWLVLDEAEIARYRRLPADEPAAYVADGNHRSAAAAQLGNEHFLAVFFPTSRLGLEPYNRLLPSPPMPASEFLTRLGETFLVETLGPPAEYRPESVHVIGLYLGGDWYRLTPKPGTYDASNAAEAIDADIVQRQIIERLYGLADPRDKRINYVGGNKDSRYLKSRVDAGDYGAALSLAPVTMDQFIAVCEQNRFMPPKSTWFDPKIRTGLVVALLD